MCPAHSEDGLATDGEAAVPRLAVVMPGRLMALRRACRAAAGLPPTGQMGMPSVLWDCPIYYGQAGVGGVGQKPENIGGRYCRIWCEDSEDGKADEHKGNHGYKGLENDQFHVRRMQTLKHHQ